MLIAGAGTLFAQDEQAEDAEESVYLEGGSARRELVFTASRIDEPLEKVPAHITVISAQDIADSGAKNVVDALETVAGVRFHGAQAGAGSDTVSMRGFGENSHGRVLVLVDGRRLNNPDMQSINWNAISLIDIERIEVMDGSAAVQYGSNAVGGVINIITKKTGGRRTALLLGGGSFFNNESALSHVEDGGWGGFSVSAAHTGAKGYRTRQASQVTNLSARGTLNLGSALRLSLDAAFADLYYQLPGGLTKAQFDDDPTQALRPTSYGSDVFIFNSGDENTERDYSGGLTLDWQPLQPLFVTLPVSYTGKTIAADLESSSSYTDRESAAVEARPQFTMQCAFGDMKLRLLGGVDTYWTRLAVKGYNALDRSEASRSYDSTVSQWTLGPYLTARFEPLSLFAVSTGVRYDTAQVTMDTEGASGDADGSVRHGELVYDAGVTINPLPSLKIFARYATLFRYPFVDEQALYQGMGAGFNKDLKPETGFNAEGGTAVSFGSVAALDANVFFMRLTDEIAYDMTLLKNMNLDTTQRFGANVHARATPVTFLALDASYSFVNAVFAEGANKDKRIPLVPEHTLYAQLSVILPFGLSFGPDVEFASPFYADAANKNEIDGYLLWGAKLRCALTKDARDFSVQLAARNITDVHYTTNVYYSAYYPADGRSINVSLRYVF
jgi:iron complex outermembrane receptor protein